ncbi:uncharacterized protein Z520_02392 [Fonsecaea multimorphosa CBS 102226]|uniref:NAD(P)-binding domain-containing protein n=1 Tax=Fonsecaea multimorphosa CBS 102226 TaxID=1442371 RepID=A0A0D2KZS0_9EURO|nr:uncharacterized protein Z520_02392 [Fonsecaea multimorphosa CBS 102226]KIY02254.1 hypothetical protein Z520_02392 [Fonsecaea multimorphosa CBS 102226]OAL28902.1 hypothetical protein AYO22_02338 [Fonsecaea multimorphosa]
MKIALVGFGDVGRYFLEEFYRSPTDEVVLLSRRKQTLPEDFQVEQRVTQYTVEELSKHLEDCDAVVSTLGGPDDAYISAHLAILETCVRSPKCKRFIPSEYTVNVRDFPDQPVYILRSRNIVREALRAQSTVKWTIVCNGWFMDYLLPLNQRYLKDLSNGWVTDNEAKVFELYGDALQRVSLTSVRDTARAVLEIVHDEDHDWEECSMFSSQTLTYLDLFNLIKKRDPSWTVRTVSLASILDTIRHETDPDLLSLAYLRIMGFTNANSIPESQAGRPGGPRACGRDVETFLNEAESNRAKIP